MEEKNYSDNIDHVKKRHHILLKQSCALIGRDYDIVRGFNNYREEFNTILSAMAIIIVCTLAFFTLSTAIDYLIYDFIEPNFDKKFIDMVYSAKIGIPAFWVIVIYVIDMSILNHARHEDESKKSEPSTIIDALKGGFLKYIPSNPLVIFRISLILCSAMLSALFVIAKFNEQLISSNINVTAQKKEESLIEQKKLLESDASNKKSTIYSDIKRYNDEILRLSEEKITSKAKRDKDIASVNANKTRESSRAREQRKICEEQAYIDQSSGSCSKYAAEINNISSSSRATINEIEANYKSEIMEIDGKLSTFNQKIIELKNSEKTLISQTKEEAIKIKNEIDHIPARSKEEMQKTRSFGNLIKYMANGDAEGRIVSITVFTIVCVFFIIIDGSVLILKYSSYSLYDKEMDSRYRKKIAELEAQEAAHRNRINGGNA